MRYLFSTFILILFLFPETTFSQQEYVIHGENIILITEVEGPLTLLSEKENKKYRFFSKKGDTITELKNTKVDGKEQNIKSFYKIKHKMQLFL